MAALIRCAQIGVTALVALIASTSVAVGQAVDFSGTWVTRGPAGFSLIRCEHRMLGRPCGVDALQARGYTIVVRQMGDQVVLEFPGGRKNMFTRPTFIADGQTHTVVEDRDQFWTKFITRAEWAGQSLVLRATSFGGWPETDPELAPLPTFPFESTYTLKLNAAADVLVLTMRVADEKYETEYTQEFARR